MSKSDQDAIVTVFLWLAGLAVLGFILWLIASVIQFLSDNTFVYGLIVGLIVGSILTFVIPTWVIPWLRDKFIPWLKGL